MFFLQQTESYSAQTGGSVTLDCTVLPGTNNSQHSVYWFKQDLGKTRLGILYVDSHSGGQCLPCTRGGGSLCYVRCQCQVSGPISYIMYALNTISYH